MKVTLEGKQPFIQYAPSNLPIDGFPDTIDFGLVFQKIIVSAEGCFLGPTKQRAA